MVAVRGDMSSRYCAGTGETGSNEATRRGLVVRRGSAVNLDSIESASMAMLVERLGRVGSDRMSDICAALAVAVDCSG